MYFFALCKICIWCILAKTHKIKKVQIQRGITTHWRQQQPFLRWKTRSICWFTSKQLKYYLFIFNDFMKRYCFWSKWKLRVVNATCVNKLKERRRFLMIFLKWTKHSFKEKRMSSSGMMLIQFCSHNCSKVKILLSPNTNESFNKLCLDFMTRGLWREMTNLVMHWWTMNHFHSTMTKTSKQQGDEGEGKFHLAEILSSILIFHSFFFVAYIL